MDSIKDAGSGVPREERTVRFVDITGLVNVTGDWTPVCFVHSGAGKAGVIERERATSYYRFTPADPGLGAPVRGDFSVDKLKRRITEWLERPADDAAS
ncbi:MAG: hypothetical protein ACREUU_19770 [Gammaproteobacteria bacterium]